MTSPAAPPSRATSVSGIRERMANFQSAEGARHCAAFRPRADDVIIATYPKSGTTWMQQIVHALRTGGEMDFEEITQVVPWLEMAHDMDIDLEQSQSAGVRAFKTHMNGEIAPGGCRYIFVVRDPRDVAVSFYRFFEGWLFEPGTIDIDTFCREFFVTGSRSGSYWSHLLSWCRRRSADSILMLAFEEMKTDLAGTVERVADFLRMDDAAARRIAVSRSSLDTMRRHASKFDDHLLRARRDAACGLPPGGNSDKVARGAVGGYRDRLSAATVALLDEQWQTEISPALGVEDYAQFLATLPDRRAKALGANSM